MCEYSTKLVAWLDQELPPGDAATMEQHVPECHECRDLVIVYQDVGRTFEQYTKEMDLRPAARRSKRSVILALASALAAAAVVLFVVAPHHRPDELPRPNQMPRVDAAPPPAAAIALPSERSRPHSAAFRRRATIPKPVPIQSWMPVQPTIQIAIPSDALFPPGAVPDGFAFVADLSLAADGSPAELALRP